MTQTVHLACAADAAYLPHCAVVARSAIAYHSGPICLHFLHAQNLAPDLLEALAADVTAAGAQFRAHAISPNQVDSLAVTDRIPAVMWYRIFLPQLLPELNRVLYLDCDTLVVSALDELWRCELGDALVGAVENIFEPKAPKRHESLGLPNTQGYFNSGVLLMNLAAWRADGTTERLVRYARLTGDDLIWPDQDALNVITGHRRLQLHPRWNCQNSMYYFPHAADGLNSEDIAEATRSPAIVHFEGPGFCKPWHLLCRHRYSATYRRLRRQSAWRDFTLEGDRSIWNQLLLRLPMRWIPFALRLQETAHGANVLRRLARRLRGGNVG